MKSKVISDVDPRIIPPDVLKRLEEAADVHLGISSDEQFMREVVDAEAIFLGSALKDINESIIESATRLRIVARIGVGYDRVDVNACTRHGVYVTITPVNSIAVAELTVALMLCLSRDLIKVDRYSRQKWAVEREWRRLGFDLKGKTCGIVGLGRIGFEVAKRAHAFEMRILYCDILRNRQAEDEFGAKREELDVLLKESDYVTLHVFLDEKTRGMIGRRELSLMRESAYIINTSRGAVIDQSALIDFLKANRIAGAGLDTFEEEPVPLDAALLSLDNVVLSPHIGSATVETRHATAQMAVNNILAALKAEVPLNVVPEQKGKVFRKNCPPNENSPG
jgi:lactate dehydrogenase-like 2-hydroxyacid dehydrogenase